jgi:hypothetical protein
MRKVLMSKHNDTFGRLEYMIIKVMLLILLLIAVIKIIWNESGTLFR